MDISKIESPLSRLNQLSDIYVDDIEAIISNIRWITTLCLAEIAALASYRELGTQPNLSIKFAVVILFLAASITVFVLVAIIARLGKRSIRASVQLFILESEKTLFNTDLTGKEIESAIEEKEKETQKKIASFTELPNRLEAYGLTFFAIGTVLAAVFVFLLELASLFYIG